MGRSAAGTTCSVARMSHVLTRVFVLPECIPDVAGFAFDPDHGLQLCGRHDLRLDAADVADDSNQILLWCLADEVVTGEAELMHLTPGHVSGDGALGLQ